MALRAADGMQISDAVAEEALRGQLLNEHDLRGDEDRWRTGIKGRGDLNFGFLDVALAALETQAPAGHVFTGNNVVGEVLIADAGLETYFGANVLAAIFLACGARCGRGERGI